MAGIEGITNLSAAYKDVLYGSEGELGASFSREVACINIAAILLLLVASFFGNTSICLVVYRFRHLRTLTNSLLCSLAVTDILTPCFRLLFIAVSTAFDRWVFGKHLCVLSSVLGVFLGSSSILHLTAITLERYVAIQWPLHHSAWMTKRKVLAGLWAIWTVSLVMSLFPYFGFVRMAFNADLLDCEIYWQEKPDLSIMLAGAYFVFPFAVMLVVYYQIYKHVRYQRRLESRLIVSNLPTRKSNTLGKELKTVKVVSVVIGMFFILWCPIFVVTVVRSYKPSAVSGWLVRIAFFLAYSNSGCNWIIYSIMNKNMRHAFHRLLGCHSQHDRTARRVVEPLSRIVRDATRRSFPFARKVERPQVASARNPSEHHEL